MNPSKHFYLTLAAGVLVLGLVLGAIFLNACTIRLQAAAVEPACCVICTPIASPTVPAPTPVKTPTVAPSPLPSATPTRTAPAPSITPTPGAFQTTGGRAVIRIDLTQFRIATGSDGKPLDYYAAATLLWKSPPGGSTKPDTPALELSIRGTTGEQCVTSPCGDSLGLVARWSANVRHDAGQPDEKNHCGEGVNYRFRLPIGPEPVFDAVVEWGPDRRRVTVSTKWGSWTAKRGVDVPGFGQFYEGIANAPKGIGWARSPWAIQENGGTATLVSWEKVEPVAALSRCP